jgi:tetratricopeptide (TPR) repeat protein
MKLLLLFALLAGCSDFSAGLEAYREGRYAEAQTIFEVAAADLQGQSLAVAQFNLALVALQLDQPRQAESLAEKAMRAGGRDGQVDFVATRDFILGNTTYARALESVQKARLPGASLRVIDLAISQTEAAVGHWRAAAISRVDWPQARRNIERAQLTLEQLRAARAQVLQQQNGQAKAPPKDADWQDSEATPDPSQPQPVKLSVQQMQVLMQELQQGKDQQRKLRKDRRAEAVVKVDKDW